MALVLGSVKTASLTARRAGNGVGALCQSASGVYPQPSSTVCRPPSALTQKAMDSQPGCSGPLTQCRLVATTALFAVFWSTHAMAAAASGLIGLPSVWGAIGPPLVTASTAKSILGSW